MVIVKVRSEKEGKRMLEEDKRGENLYNERFNMEEKEN